MILPALLTWATLQEPVFMLEKVPLSCEGRADQTSCRFAAPSLSAGKHVRLSANCRGNALVNGALVQKDETGWPVTGRLHSGRDNQVLWREHCTEAVLLVSPRFYVVYAKPNPESRKLLILIENTLDNTVNYSLRVETAAGTRIWEEPGTLGAGVRRLVEFPWTAQGTREKLMTTLWKGSEAVEGGYLFLQPVD